MAGTLYQFKDDFYITNAQFEAGQGPIINEDQNSKGFTQAGKPVTPSMYTSAVTQDSSMSEVDSSGRVIGTGSWARYSHSHNGNSADPRFSQSIDMASNIGYMGEMNFSTTPLRIDIDTSQLLDVGGTLKFTASNITTAIPKITNHTPSTGTRYLNVDTFFVVPNDATANAGQSSIPGSRIYFE